MTHLQDVRGGGRLRSDLIPPGIASSGPPSSQVADSPRTPSEVPDPVVISGGEQTGRASVTVSYCSYCFNVATEYRSDLGEWLCRRCSQSVPQMCESCQTRKADIIEWGYAVCSSCRAGRNR